MFSVLIVQELSFLYLLVDAVWHFVCRICFVVCDQSLHSTVTVIGRGLNQVDYFISSANENQNLYVSRIHARVVRSGAVYSIRDDSRNGIFVNNVKIAGLH